MKQAADAVGGEDKKIAVSLFRAIDDAKLVDVKECLDKLSPDQVVRLGYSDAYGEGKNYLGWKKTARLVYLKGEGSKHSISSSKLDANKEMGERTLLWYAVSTIGSDSRWRCGYSKKLQARLSVVRALLEYDFDIDETNYFYHKKSDRYFYGALLHMAVATGDLDLVWMILAKKPDLNSACDELRPLNFAVGRDDSNMVEVLLNAGADPRIHFIKELWCRRGTKTVPGHQVTIKKKIRTLLLDAIQKWPNTQIKKQEVAQPDQDRAIKSRSDDGIDEKRDGRKFARDDEDTPRASLDLPVDGKASVPPGSKDSDLKSLEEQSERLFEAWVATKGFGSLSPWIESRKRYEAARHDGSRSHRDSDRAVNESLSTQKDVASESEKSVSEGAMLGEISKDLVGSRVIADAEFSGGLRVEVDGDAS